MSVKAATTQLTVHIDNGQRVPISADVDIYKYDKSLPTNVKISDYFDDFVEELRSTLKETGRTTTFFDDPTATYYFTTVGGDVLDENKSLHEHGIYDASMLFLAKNPNLNPYKKVIDDVPEALSEYKTHTFGSWNTSLSRKYMPLLVSIPVAILCLIVTIDIVFTPIFGSLRTIWEMSLWLGFAFIVSWFAVLYHVDKKPKYLYIPLLAYLFAICASSLWIPRPFSFSHVFVISIAMIITGLLLKTLVPLYYQLNIMCLTCASMMAFATGISLIPWVRIYVHPNEVSIVSFLFLIAVFGFNESQILAIKIGNIEIPWLPQSANAYKDDFKHMQKLSAIKLHSLSEVQKAINQEENIKLAYRVELGLASGFGITFVLGSLFLGCVTAGRQLWYVCALVLITAVLIFGRAKINSEPKMQLVGLFSSALMPAVWLVGLLFNAHFPVVVFETSAALYIGALVFAVFYVLRDFRLKTPTVMKFRDNVEAALWMAPALLVVMILDAISRIRGR